MATLEPVRVLTVELSDPPRDLACVNADGVPYAGAWILACDNGYPVGSVEVPAQAGIIPAAVLGRALRERFPAHEPRMRLVDDVGLERATVVVPTAARRAQLQRCVAALRELDHPDFEVIVVDNRREGDPISFDGVRVIREPRPGISAARNRGLAEATGSIIAFTDDDVDVDRGWLRALGRRFAADRTLAAVTGLVVPSELETPAQILFEQSGSGLDRSYQPLVFERSGRFGLRRQGCWDGSERVGSVYQTGELGLGSNMAFRTSVLRAAGGFDLALGVGTPTHGGEDLAVLLELVMHGHRVGYEPSAIVGHTHRATMDDLHRQIRGYGVGFTAMLTALVVHDPRHIAGLASVIPRWLRSLRDPGQGKGSDRGADYPRELSRSERRGMLAGPAAYFRARRSQRRWVA